MSELSTLIAKRLAFDESWARVILKSSRGTGVESLSLMQIERARTQSLDALWTEVIEVLDRSIEVMQFAYMNAPKQPPEIAQALAVLTKLKKACEGEG